MHVSSPISETIHVNLLITTIKKNKIIYLLFCGIKHFHYSSSIFTFISLHLYCNIYYFNYLILKCSNRKHKTHNFFPFLSSLFSSKWSDPSFTYFSYFLFCKPKALQKCFINYTTFWGLSDSLIIMIFSPIFIFVVQTPLLPLSLST